MNLRILIVAILSLAFATNGSAWGTQGHQVVANLAYAQLTAKAKTEVGRLLAFEPGATLASISIWADETRNRTTAPWHYVNFPRDTCTYAAQRDCPDGQCVVGAIERQLAVLASEAPGEKRLNALKYVVHFVADVHQPLHAGYADDRGGNRYQLQTFGRGANLQALWDTALIENTDTAVEKLTAIHADDVDPAHAAQESCRIVGMAGFYPERKVGAVHAGDGEAVGGGRCETGGAVESDLAVEVTGSKAVVTEVEITRQICIARHFSASAWNLPPLPRRICQNVDT
jgi:nuclease S1